MWYLVTFYVGACAGAFAFALATGPEPTSPSTGRAP
jgi:hypothetical protein